MRESRTYGSERGASSNGRPYRDRFEIQNRVISKCCCIEAWISKTNALTVAGASNSDEIVPRLRKLG